MNFIPYIKKHYRTITLASYLLPILLAVIVSLAHVVTFWAITNPLSWAIFLSVAIEVAVLSSIAAGRISNWVWFPFLIVTVIQIIGNIFYSYTHIDITDKLFKDWVELSDPFFNWMGWDTAGNAIIHKRIIAVFSGATIPLIAITFFSFFIRATRERQETSVTTAAGEVESANPVFIESPEMIQPAIVEMPEPMPVIEVSAVSPISEEPETIADIEKTGSAEPIIEFDSVTPPSLAQVATEPEVLKPNSQLKLFDDSDYLVTENQPQNKITVFEDEKKNY